MKQAKTPEPTPRPKLYCVAITADYDEEVFILAKSDRDAELDAPIPDVEIRKHAEEITDAEAEKLIMRRGYSEAKIVLGAGSRTLAAMTLKDWVATADERKRQAEFDALPKLFPVTPTLIKPEDE